MNGHLEQWLDAYLDGELDAIQILQADAHLKNCQACRMELEQRRALSQILREAPAPAFGKSDQRFVSEIALRLPRTAPAIRPESRPTAVWVMVPPFALFLAWAFIQSAMIVVGALQWLPGLEDAIRDGFEAGWIPESAAGLALPALPAPGVWDVVFLTAALVGIGMLFTGWFAGWWAGQRTAGSQQ
jgi:anti-sigma factor RsiW